MTDACTEFHSYQFTWTASRITVGVDDHNYYQYSNDHSGNAEWPFDSPQYLILNIAVGGDWGGQQGVNDAIFPVRDGRSTTCASTSRKTVPGHANRQNSARFRAALRKLPVPAPSHPRQRSARVRSRMASSARR